MDKGNGFLSQVCKTIVREKKEQEEEWKKKGGFILTLTELHFPHLNAVHNEQMEVGRYPPGTKLGN
jgi:hypothetical protein